MSVGSATVAHPLFQAEGGGSNPAPTIHILSGNRETMQATVDWMIGKHYLKRWPGTVMRVFRLDYNGAPCGVCVYSLPPRESFVRYGVSLAWELSRLWITDEMPIKGGAV